jgi:hypothetical protein
MTFILTIIAMSVHAIFIYRREILFDTKKFKILVAISLGLIGLFYLTKGLGIAIRNIEILTIPFFVLMVFLLMSTIYRMIFKVNAQDSYHSMDIRLMKDGIFNFLFWVIGLLLPVFIAFEVLGDK